jgi:Zn-dependent protease
LIIVFRQRLHIKLPSSFCKLTFCVRSVLFFAWLLFAAFFGPLPHSLHTLDICCIIRKCYYPPSSQVRQSSVYYCILHCEEYSQDLLFCQDIYTYFISMDDLGRLFFFIIIIPSAIIHEYMHGWVANQLGDPTAKYAGRLTLNPMVHVDIWGTFLLPLMLFIGSGGSFLFAYAKPVPYNPYNLKDQKWGPVWVALAGPFSNFFLAAVFGLLLQVLPLPAIAATLVSIVVYANVLLAVFNLVPIPPLDGSKLLYALLPDSMNHVKVFLEQYGFVILLIFIFFFFRLISPFVFFFYNLFTGGGGLF